MVEASGSNGKAEILGENTVLRKIYKLKTKDFLYTFLWAYTNQRQGGSWPRYTTQDFGKLGPKGVHRIICRHLSDVVKGSLLRSEIKR